MTSRVRAIRAAHAALVAGATDRQAAEAGRGACETPASRRDHEGFAALCAALDPAVRTFETVMQGINRNRFTDCAETILAELTRQGKISLDDIEAAFTAWRDRPDPE